MAGGAARGGARDDGESSLPSYSRVLPRAYCRLAPNNGPMHKCMPAGAAVEADRLVVEIDEVVRAGRSAVDALNSAIAQCSLAQEEIAANVAVADALHGLLARASREEVASSMERYQIALRRLRERSIVLLIEQEGLTLTEVGRRMGVSRHMVARLYNSALTARGCD